MASRTSAASPLLEAFVAGALCLGCSASSGSAFDSAARGEATGGAPTGGGRGAGGTAPITIDDGGLSKDTLSASIVQNHVAVQVVTVGCAGTCADVEAVATGGHAPYTFAWEDGSTNPVRHLCPTATAVYRVSVTDTSTTSGEFTTPAETAQADVTANVAQCGVVAPDGSAPAHVDAGTSCGPGGGPTTLPETITSDVLTGNVVYYANGSVLPPGHYRVTYEGGCMMYDAFEGWTLGPGFWFVGSATTDQLLKPPPTVTTSFPTFQACVDAANQQPPSADFDFAGGKLGVWLDDFPYQDNVAGTNGQSPSWRVEFCAP